MADKAKIAILISGAGTNMAALVYASRIGACPYEVVLVASNDPQSSRAQTAASGPSGASGLRAPGSQRSRLR